MGTASRFEMTSELICLWDDDLEGTREHMNHRILTTVVLCGLFAVCASPQDAAVAELSKEDSAKAAELYKELRAAEQEWAAFKTSVQQRYGPTLAKGLPPGRRVGVQNTGQPQFFIPSEWSAGIEFSTDFRFAVPTSKQ